ncbi:unnamed protein product [Scytosiphon promiscuus]
MDAKAGCTLVPCGHLCLCVECAGRLNKCPICCKNVVDRIKTYRA